jgi:hypothetical protein
VPSVSSRVRDAPDHDWQIVAPQCGPDQIHQPFQIRLVSLSDLGIQRRVAFSLHPNDPGGNQRVRFAVIGDKCHAPA